MSLDMDLGHEPGSVNCEQRYLRLALRVLSLPRL